MRAITLTQPWATLVAIGAKQVETRSWSTNYRGPLAIHTAKGFPGWARELCYDEPFLSALEQARVGPAGFPLGKVIATAELINVQRIGYHVMPLHQTNEGHQRELAFGDYSKGRYAWFLGNVQPLPEPVPARGALGLWEWREAAA